MTVRAALTDDRGEVVAGQPARGPDFTPVLELAVPAGRRALVGARATRISTT